MTMEKTYMSFFQSIQTLFFTIDISDRRKFYSLTVFAFLSALSELGLAGTVALLASFFSSTQKTLEFLPSFTYPYFTFLGDNVQNIIFMALILVIIVIIVKSILVLLTQYYSSSFSQKVSRTLSSKLMHFCVKGPYLQLTNIGSTKLLFNFNILEQVAISLYIGIQVVNNGLIFIIMLAGLLISSFQPSLVLFSIIIVGTYIVFKIMKGPFAKASDSAYEARFDAHAIRLLGINAMKEMRLYNRGELLEKRYDTALRGFSRATIVVESFSRLPVVLIELLGFCGLLVILGFMIWVQDASLARITGTMGFLAAAAWRLLPIANRTVHLWSQAKTLAPYLIETANFLKEDKYLPLRDELSTFSNSESFIFKEKIELKNISFSYPNADKLVLRNISFTIPKGSMLGLVGLSGAGKSTFVDIFSGLIPPTKGYIEIDGQRLCKTNIQKWFEKIGYVSQTPHIISASLLENIGLSRWGEKIDRKRASKCAELAALDFLGDLEEGLDTFLGEGGTKLSGGQAQRVVIGRALYTNPEIIIFDEATSSLDIKNEKLIHDTIHSLKNRATILIIAHRLSAIENCDYLLWLDKSEMRMFGKREEVLPYYIDFIEKK